MNYAYEISLKKFRSVFNVILGNPEAYLEHRQDFKMALMKKIVNRFISKAIIAKCFILHNWQG